VGYRILALITIAAFIVPLLKKQTHPERERSRQSILKLISLIGFLALILRIVRLKYGI
jgi:hypothetical protein